jgi:hypothetical protein
MAHQTFFKHDMPSRVATAREQEAADAAKWKAVCKSVDQRDGRQCRCCDKRSDPEATGLLKRGHRHHIIYRSAGGPDDTWNLVTLCAGCHDDEHHNRLRLTGFGDPINADGPMVFWRKDEDGHWFIAREEIAVRLVRRD